MESFFVFAWLGLFCVGSVYGDILPPLETEEENNTEWNIHISGVKWFTKHMPSLSSNNDQVNTNNCQVLEPNQHGLSSRSPSLSLSLFHRIYYLYVCLLYIAVLGVMGWIDDSSKTGMYLFPSLSFYLYL